MLISTGVEGEEEGEEGEKVNYKICLTRVNKQKEYISLHIEQSSLV